jgi:hypothetical protein
VESGRELALSAALVQQRPHPQTQAIASQTLNLADSLTTNMLGAGIEATGRYGKEISVVLWVCKSGDYED